MKNPKYVFREKINWNELNCRILTHKNGGSSVTESIKKMHISKISPSDLTLEIQDQFIGPCGEEPDILFCCGSTNLISTAGYPPWVSPNV